MKPSTQEELGELTVANTPAWAAATIEKYNKKGLVVDCLLWTQLIGNYNRAIIALRAEVASLKEMASPSGKFALQMRDERDAAKLDGDKLRAELAAAEKHVEIANAATADWHSRFEQVNGQLAEANARVAKLVGAFKDVYTIAQAGQIADLEWFERVIAKAEAAQKGS